jgi:hypothetical protein
LNLTIVPIVAGICNFSRQGRQDGMFEQLYKEVNRDKAVL